ncbi:MAG: response regulator, partial [Pseudomonadota bacterium]|nr:response regulator [Pseudomonadota bacterium]
MPDEQPSADFEQVPARAGSCRQGRILVVEDDSAVRAFLSRALEHAGHSVIAVEDADLALKVLKRQPSFDVIVSDIVMPGSMDGLALSG